MVRVIAGFVLRLLGRFWIGAVLGMLILLAPLPEEWDPRVLALQTPVGILVLLCSLGKALYDTLFFDHYRA